MLGYESADEVLALKISRDVYVDANDRESLWYALRNLDLTGSNCAPKERIVCVTSSSPGFMLARAGLRSRRVGQICPNLA